MPGTGRAGKPRNKPPNLKDKTQSERFVETAKALEADESGKVFERALSSITMPQVAPTISKTSFKKSAVSKK